MPQRKNRRYFVVTWALVAGVLLIVSVIQLRSAYVASLENSAILAADSYTKALEAMRALYTSEVVSRLPETVPATHDYLLHENAVPLPATLTVLMTDRLDEAVEGIEVRLFSEYPFPWRAPVTIDEFERRALAALSTRPDTTYVEFEDTQPGRRLRFARGDPMRAECVACHNAHPDSPKKDWVVGDLRGVLEVSLPLASFEQSARAARRPYEALLALALLALLGALVFLALPDHEVEERKRQAEMAARKTE